MSGAPAPREPLPEPRTVTVILAVFLCFLWASVYFVAKTGAEVRASHVRACEVACGNFGVAYVRETGAEHPPDCVCGDAGGAP